MDQVFSYLDVVVAGNSVLEWVIALGVFIVVFIALQIIRLLIVKRLHQLAQKTHSKLDDVISGFFHSMKTPVFVLIAFYVAVRGVEIPDSLQLILRAALIVVVVSQTVSLLEEVFVLMLRKQFTKDDPDAKMPGIFRVSIRILLWSIGILLILSNLGVDITSLIAGLGIGGLAVSLALQSILSDLFASFSIAVDKPFVIGDFIIVGEHQGTVKHIGLKSTRITSIGGEEIVISNTELTSARVQNYKKMQRRRVVFNIGVTYDTPHEKLSKANELIEQSMNGIENVEFDRSHFFEFGDSALMYEVVFFMTTNDYKLYMAARQQINMQIHEKFAAEGIEMAFPTQTLYLKKEN